MAAARASGLMPLKYSMQSTSRLLYSAINLGEMDFRLVFEICRECLGVVCLKTQVHFMQGIATEFVDQALGLVSSEKKLQKAPKQAQQAGVCLNSLPDAGLEHFEDDAFARHAA